MVVYWKGLIELTHFKTVRLCYGIPTLVYFTRYPRVCNPLNDKCKCILFAVLCSLRLICVIALSEASTNGEEHYSEKNATIIETRKRGSPHRGTSSSSAWWFDLLIWSSRAEIDSSAASIRAASAARTQAHSAYLHRTPVQEYEEQAHPPPSQSAPQTRGRKIIT